MTKMTAMAIKSKKKKKKKGKKKKRKRDKIKNSFFFRTRRPMAYDFETWREASDLGALHSLYKS